MPASIFTDKAQPPQTDSLSEALGAATSLWDDLKARVARCVPVADEWKFYNQRSGWTLLLKHKQRTLLYLSPRRGEFAVIFVLGEKAVQAANHSSLPPDLLERLNAAHAYVEGRSLSLDVRSATDLEVVETLLAIKLSA